MSDTQLRGAWGAGRQWLEAHWQDGTANRLGEPYDGQAFWLGLERLEEIETELQARKLDYG